MTLSGIYKIQSIIKPDRLYIGSAKNIHKRWAQHSSLLKLNKHSSVKLQRHYNKYGASDLQFSILLGCENDDLIKIEQYFIDTYNPWFNILPTAGSQLGAKRTDEQRKKISLSHIGIKWSAERRASMKGRKSNKGTKWANDESRRKLSEFRKQFKVSDETREKMSNAIKLYYASDEAKEKRKLLRGRKRSDEFKQKIKDSWIIRKQKKIA